MAKIFLFALTGGPGAGKTSALNFIRESLLKYGVQTIVINEQSTALRESGKTPEAMGDYAFHALLFANQLAAEEQAIEQAKLSTAEKVLILCDRGLLDSRAYVSAELFAQYAGEHGMNEEKIRSRYDAVFHLVTAADGAEEFYTLDNNKERHETPEQARECDIEVLSHWVGANHLRMIDNSTGFGGKLARLLNEVLGALGIPEPLEIERKLLIEYPDTDFLKSLKTCRRIPITQAYMNTPEEGIFRVRKRGEGEDAQYIKTKKIKINDLKRIEIEDYISKEEYYTYLKRRNCVQGMISKDRYCLAWHWQYFELDVYPFWADKATIEIELLSEDQPFELPDFLTLIRDVSYEKEFRNKQLAVKYGRYLFG